MRTECIHVIEGKKSIVLNYCFGVAINNVTTMLQQCYNNVTDTMCIAIVCLRCSCNWRKEEYCVELLFWCCHQQCYNNVTTMLQTPCVLL